MAVAPAPPTTRTDVIDPVWVTVASAAPAPERSAAPISLRRMSRINVTITLNGMVNINPGKIDTRATNQHWWMNSRKAKGVLTNATAVSRDIAKKLPTSRSGVARARAGLADALADCPAGSRAGLAGVSVATTSGPPV